MQILFTCGREPEYPRNALLKKILEEHYPITALTDSSRSYGKRYLRIFRKIIFHPLKQFDLIFVGFLGQPIVPLIRMRSQGPVLLDAFLSVYDTLCFDRKKFSPGSLPGRFAYWLDKTSCQLADHILLDTQAHTDYFAKTFHLPKEKFSSIFVGCDEALFYPRQAHNPQFSVLFYGSFLPLHGVETIVRAGKLLENETGIHFKIIGQGFETDRVNHLAAELDLGKNIEFYPPVPLQSLPDEISQASLCLGGHFGPSAKASRVIAGKTFQCIAMGKPTIVGDNPANRELLTHGLDAWFCKMNDPHALAEAILALSRDASLRESLGKNARKTFLKSASTPVLSRQLIELVERLLAQAG
jgi:glycosyltransferase involved in cell wall biosynthesis